MLDTGRDDVSSSVDNPTAPGNGRLELDGLAQPRRTGLGFPHQMSFNAWCRIGKQLSVISDASVWWLGDWLIYGQVTYPDHYRRAIAGSGLNYQTLRNYAWVTRKFARSRRREHLTFQHHAEVAGYSNHEQDYWLSKAERLHWSRNELRKQLRAARGERMRQSPPTVPVVLKVVPDQRERWRMAAQAVNSDLDKWIVMTLDDEAERIFETDLKVELAAPDATAARSVPERNGERLVHLPVRRRRGISLPCARPSGRASQDAGIAGRRPGHRARRADTPCPFRGSAGSQPRPARPADRAAPVHRAPHRHRADG